VVFSVVTPYSSEIVRRFGGTYRLHFRVEKQAKQETTAWAYFYFLIGLLLAPEDGGDILLRNV
jgi:hypothetical protein